MIEFNRENLTEVAELYHQGKLSPQEMESFEHFLNENPDLKEQATSFTNFLQSLDYYGESLSLKKKLEIYHMEINKEGKLIVLNTNNWRHRLASSLLQTMDAAAIDLIAVISVLYIGGWFDYKNRIAQYDELKKDVDNISNEQKSIWQEIFSSNKKSAVRYSGTGICFSTNGFILTNYHLVRNCDSVHLINTFDSFIAFNAHVVFKDPSTDLAILQIRDVNFTGFNMIPFTFHKGLDDLGEDVFTLGYSKEDIVYGEGYISSRTGFNNDTLSYEVSITANPGNSGAPLFNSKGFLIGMISGKHSLNINSTYAVKSSYLLNAIEELAKDSLSEQPEILHVKNLKRLSKTEQIKMLQPYVFRVNNYE